MSFFNSIVDSYKRVLSNNNDGRLRGRKGVFFGTVAESAVTTMLTGIFYSTLLTVLLKGATETVENKYLALIETLTAFVGLSQLFSPFIFESLKKRKPLILLLRGVYYLIQILLLPLVTILKLPIDTKAWMFIVLMVVATISESIGTPARSAWHLHSLPEDTRSDYYSCIRLSTMVINASLSFILGVFMDYCAEHEIVLVGVLIMRGVALPLAAFVIGMFFRAEEPNYNANIEKVTFKDIVTTPFRSPIFLVMVLINVLYTMGNGFHGQFYNYYLVNQVEISYTYLSICQISAIPCTFISMPFWNRQVRKYGWMPTLAVSMALYSLCYVINAFVAPGTEYMYIISNVYCQLINGGLVIAISNLPFLHVPDSMKAACLAFFNAASSLAGTFSRWLGGVFIGATEGLQLSIWGLTLENRSYMCLVNSGILLLDVLVVIGVSIYEKKQKNKMQPKQEETINGN